MSYNSAFELFKMSYFPYFQFPYFVLSISLKELF